MIKKYKDWYYSLTPFKRLVVSFIVNWFYWLIVWLIADQFFFEEKHTLKNHLFHATWMSFFMTVPFSWKVIKELFKLKRNSNP